MRLHPREQSGKGDRLVFEIFLVYLPCFLYLLSAVTSQPGYAIPAFARKYGLPCSACHIGWPILNNFGLALKDNGYQLGNDKDSPIYQKMRHIFQLHSGLPRSGIWRTRTRC